MKLKRLETYGFKSFADRMTFDFDQGITAIIGPNGCGKSNIVDAVKWVIGEQSAKALRGSDMSDCIFNGCATRRPMSMAEVTLTLEHQGLLGEAAGEVAITRRLTKEGQSSYYINGKPSRLKDIRELLMGTGMGTSAYAVIEQGRIGFILEASTKDRRAILEEAAGISRYKARRKVALRKLERVETDLERIGQVLGEVEKRHTRVSKQAETALRYQELAAKLRDMRMVFALEEYGRQSGDLAGFDQRIAELSSHEAEIAAKLGALEAKLSEADVQLVEIETTIRTTEDARAEARSKRDVAKSRLTDAKNRIVEIGEQEQEDRQALQTHDNKVAKVKEERVETVKHLDNEQDGGEKDDGIGSLYQELKKELDEILAEIDAIIADIEKEKNNEVDILRELSRLDAEQKSLAGSREGLLARRSKIEGKSQGRGTDLTSAIHVEEEAKGKVENKQKEAAEAHIQLDNFIRSREESQAEVGQIESKLNELRHERGRAEVRLNLLRDFEKRQEGVNRGVKDVIAAMDRLPGICGIVADCFRVEKDHELAIETALGGRVQNIITESQREAKEAIEFLKRERRGRATFLPLDDVRGFYGVDRRILNERGVVGEACDLVEFENKFRPAFEHLLGGIIVTETLDDAMFIRRQHRPRGMIVTLEGDVVNSGGAMTGGRHQGNNQGGLISRKNEIARLTENLDNFAANKQQLADDHNAAKKRSFDIAVQVEEQRKVIHELERAVGDAKAQLMKAERDRTHIEEFASSFSAELEEIATEIAKVDEDNAAIEVARVEFGGQQSSQEDLLKRKQEFLHERGQARDLLQEEVNNLRVNIATAEERREALRNHIGHLDRQLLELEESRKERQERINSLEQRRSELQRIIDENHVIFENEKAIFTTVSEEAAALIKQRDDIRNSVEEERNAARELNGQARKLERERQEKEIKAGEIRVRLDAMKERILDEYEVDLTEAYENYERPKDLDLPSLRRELAKTEKEFSNIGPVNLGAIDELKEVEARLSFLQKQHEDLNGAKEKLSEIIEHINTISRKLFKRTYRDTRKGFQELFRKLYGGGKADMVLEYDKETEDILEAGIDIIAQPPGKQPKSITLLSGGEKALTAIALLFAVYQTKPSPFCILDEVDAPLDESNTDVYCQMVREFCTMSQFLVITHNKRTMQYADAIYGVTQPERGVSTKISVKLEDVDAKGELVETAQGSGPFSG